MTQNKNLEGVKRNPKRTLAFCPRCLQYDKKKNKVTENEERFAYECTVCHAITPFETDDPLYWVKCSACNEIQLINKDCNEGKAPTVCQFCDTKITVAR